MTGERVESLGQYLPSRITNFLARASIYDRSQVEATTDEQLLGVRGLGRVALQVIRTAIPYTPPAPSLPSTTEDAVMTWNIRAAGLGVYQDIVDVQTCNAEWARRLLGSGAGWELLGIFPRWTRVEAVGGNPFHIRKGVTFVMGRREPIATRI